MRIPAAAALLLGLLLGPACRPAPRPGTAVMAWESFPLSLDPRQGQDHASQRLLALTHQGLLRHGPHLELRPDACLDWRWDRPYTELSFGFPRAASAPPGWPRFTPGRPLTAEDALDSLDALRDPALVSPKAGPFREEIERAWISADGATERLHLRLRASSPGFPANLVRGTFAIAPRGSRGERTPGTGPYRLADLEPERRILLVARPGHPDLAARPGIPLDLEWRLLPDATTRTLALRHGTVQVALNDIPADLLAATGDQVVRQPGANLEYVAFNCRRGPLREARVRRALSLALDRTALVKALLGGFGREAWGFFPPDLPWGEDARPRLAVPPDLPARRRRAEALLDAAGFPRGRHGLRFRLVLSSTLEVSARMKALILQDQWRAIGVGLDIRTREFGTLLSEVIAGRFEVASLRWVGATDPEMLYRTFDSAMTPPHGFNRGRYADPETDRLLAGARAAGDAAVRNRLLREAQDRLVDQAPYAFLFWPDQVAVLAPGLSTDLNAAGDFTGIWRRP